MRALSGPSWNKGPNLSSPSSLRFGSHSLPRRRPSSAGARPAFIPYPSPCPRQETMMFLLSSSCCSASKLNCICHCLSLAYPRCSVPIFQAARHNNCFSLSGMAQQLISVSAFCSLEATFVISNRVSKKCTDPLIRLDHKDWLSPNEVLKIFQHLKDADLILASFKRLCERKDYKPNVALYADVIGKLASVRKYEAVEDILNQIRSEKCRLTDEFFYELIRIYGNVVNNPEKAIETLHRMPAFSCWPTTKTFNFVLNMLVCAKQFDVIHEVYLSASQLAVKVDTCSLNILIKGLCHRGKLASAFTLLEEFSLQGLKPNATTYSTLMHGLCRHNKVDEAFELLEKMEANGCQPDTITFNILISGLCDARRVDEAMGFLHKMQMKGCSPNASSYQAVIYGLLKCENFVGAKEFMEYMLSKGILPSFRSYKVLIEGLCNQKLVNDVEWTLKQMIQRGFIPRMGTWKKILHHMISREDCFGADVSWPVSLG